MTLAPSPRIIAFIKGYEALRLKAYLPTPEDVATIGYGSTGPDIHLGMVWTEAECDARFAHDLAHFAARVAELIGDTPTTQGQFDAMVSLAYNIGVRAFTNSTVLRKHKAGEHKAASDAFSLWVKQAGKTLAGLVKRRRGEALIYSGILT
jgi:lysozyme